MNQLPHLTENAQHLSDEQLYCLLEDSGNASAQLHLDACTACQSEFATLRASFANFRTAATGYAATQTPALTQRVIVPSRSSWIPRPMWAASFAGAVAVLGVSLSLAHPHTGSVVARTPTAASPAATPEVSDEALLDGIQNDLSTSVPPSLQPLEVATSTVPAHLRN